MIKDEINNKKKFCDGSNNIWVVVKRKVLEQIIQQMKYLQLTVKKTPCHVLSFVTQALQGLAVK